MKYLLLSFIAVTFLATGEALKCYECTSLINSTCADPFDKTGMDEVSFPEGCVCVKGVVVSSNVTVYQRSCIERITLPISQGLDRAVLGPVELISMNYCDTDLCNGSSSIAAAVSTLMGLLIMLMFTH